MICVLCIYIYVNFTTVFSIQWIHLSSHGLCKRQQFAWTWSNWWTWYASSACRQHNKQPLQPLLLQVFLGLYFQSFNKVIDLDKKQSHQQTNCVLLMSWNPGSCSSCSRRSCRRCWSFSALALVIFGTQDSKHEMQVNACARVFT